MTKEEKAQKIVAQNGCCDGVSCHSQMVNECPCYVTCPGGGPQGYSKNLKTCQDFLAPPSLWKDAPEWANECVIEWRFCESGVKRKWISSGAYTRALTKSKEREIAEKVYEKMITGLMAKADCIDLIEAAIHKHEEETR